MDNRTPDELLSDGNKLLAEARERLVKATALAGYREKMKQLALIESLIRHENTKHVDTPIGNIETLT